MTSSQTMSASLGSVLDLEVRQPARLAAHQVGLARVVAIVRGVVVDERGVRFVGVLVEPLVAEVREEHLVDVVVVLADQARAPLRLRGVLVLRDVDHRQLVRHALEREAHRAVAARLRLDGALGRERLLERRPRQHRDDRDDRDRDHDLDEREAARAPAHGRPAAPPPGSRRRRCRARRPRPVCRPRPAARRPRRCRSGSPDRRRGCRRSRRRARRPSAGAPFGPARSGP